MYNFVRKFGLALITVLLGVTVTAGAMIVGLGHDAGSAFLADVDNRGFVSG